MKRTLTFCLAFLLCLGALAPISSAAGLNESRSASITYRGIGIVVDGQTVTPLDGGGARVEPFVMDGTTYLPVRAVAGALGLDVGWDGATSTVLLTSGGTVSLGSGTPLATSATKTASITYRDIKLSVDGRTVTPKDAAGNSVEPFLYSDTTYLPVRAVANALNVEVGWSDATSTVTLGDQSAVPTAAPTAAPKPTATPKPAAGTKPVVYTNSAPGAKTSKNSAGNVIIDYSNAASGYVMVSSKVSGDPKLVVMITCPNGTQYKYYYTDSAGVYQAFPLTEGNGSYTVGVYKNISGTKYTTLHSVSVSVSLSSSLMPFLRPNIFIDYNASTACVTAASALCAGCSTELEKVDAVYYFVVNTFSYDYSKADTVTTGYTPALDTVYSAKKGICLDYAAVMCAMLRTQGVAAKMVVGYAGSAYHAWINVYTTESGWIEAVIYFDGNTWKLMDPTFASTGKNSASIQEFINNSANYSAKYVY